MVVAVVVLLLLLLLLAVVRRRRQRRLLEPVADEYLAHLRQLDREPVVDGVQGRSATLRVLLPFWFQCCCCFCCCCCRRRPLSLLLNAPR